ncbi:MAG: D-amino-acid transaminase [Pseudomonadota bacterium]
MSVVFLNGHFLKEHEAKVSVFDRGFLFGDGVYEVIPVFNGKLFRFEEHIARLHRSLKAIDIQLDWKVNRWATLLNELIEKNAISQCSIYLQVTRGVQQQRDHVYDQEIVPTIMAMVSSLPKNNAKAFKEGISVITHEDIRWKRCDIKSISLLGNVMMRQVANQQGMTEAIVLKDGRATEGSMSNLFIVQNGKVITPQKNAELLGGVTRDLIVELLLHHQQPIEERDITLTELKNADEIWLSSSTKEIRAVVELDGKMIGEGKPGEMFRQTLELYLSYKNNLNASH